MSKTCDVHRKHPDVKWPKIWTDLLMTRIFLGSKAMTSPSRFWRLAAGVAAAGPAPLPAGGS